MARRGIADALAVHPAGLTEDAVTAASAEFDDEQLEDFAALVDLGRRLRAALVPVAPSRAYVRSLQRELAGQAARRHPRVRDPRRTALVAAAAVGSLISVASVIGAVAYVVTRRRAQTTTRPVHASM